MRAFSPEAKLHRLVQREKGEGSGGEGWGTSRGGRGGMGGGGEGAEREEGKSLPADAAAQFKLLPVVNFIREVVDQNVI